MESTNVQVEYIRRCLSEAIGYGTKDVYIKTAAHTGYPIADVRQWMHQPGQAPLRVLASLAKELGVAGQILQIINQRF